MYIYIISIYPTNALTWLGQRAYSRTEVELRSPAPGMHILRFSKWWSLLV